jgi:hypothetical protein
LFDAIKPNVLVLFREILYPFWKKVREEMRGIFKALYKGDAVLEMAA